MLMDKIKIKKMIKKEQLKKIRTKSKKKREIK
jgi:hypothetical protein